MTARWKPSRASNGCWMATRAQYGMRFYATVGNHDIFGADGRHRAKRFINDDGGYSVVSSDPQVRDRGARSIIAASTCIARVIRTGSLPWSDFGFFPRADDLHWETPFGTDGDPAARLYEVHSPDGKTVVADGRVLSGRALSRRLAVDDRCQCLRSGRWRLSGEEGDLADSTSAGWNAMLTHKPFILDWMKDVSARARDWASRCWPSPTIRCSILSTEPWTTRLPCLAHRHVRAHSGGGCWRSLDRGGHRCAFQRPSACQRHGTVPQR